MARQHYLPILLAGIRYGLDGDRGTPPPDGADFASDDAYCGHARALIALPAATAELVEARRARDAAWAKGHMVAAQAHGRKIAEAEHVIEGLLAVLRKPPVRSRKHPGKRKRKRSERQQEAEARRVEIRRLLDEGRTGKQIATELGVSTVTVSRVRREAIEVALADTLADAAD